MPGSDNGAMKYFEGGSNTSAAGGQNVSLVNCKEIHASQVRPDIFQLKF